MNQNMGTADRAIRIIIAIIIAALYLTDVISGTLAIVLGIIALVFLLTSIIGFCPVYAPLKISTRGKGSGQSITFHGCKRRGANNAPRRFNPPSLLSTRSWR